MKYRISAIILIVFIHFYKSCESANCTLPCGPHSRCILKDEKYMCMCKLGFYAVSGHCIPACSTNSCPDRNYSCIQQHKINVKLWLFDFHIACDNLYLVYYGIYIISGCIIVAVLFCIYCLFKNYNKPKTTDLSIVIYNSKRDA